MRNVTCLSLLLVCLPLSAAAAGEAELADEARELIRAFVSELKPTLQGALSEGGPGFAIEVCARRAPQIADALSAGSGWQVRRVSLQSRNASRAQPDKWERAVLEDFDQRAAQGESPASLNHSERLPGRFRYMQAQGVEPLCLVCHGTELSAEVRSTLEEFYPDDTATGYTLGRVRGAISLTRVLE